MIKQENMMQKLLVLALVFNALLFVRCTHLNQVAETTQNLIQEAINTFSKIDEVAQVNEHVRQSLIDQGIVLESSGDQSTTETANKIQEIIQILNALVFLIDNDYAVKAAFQAQQLIPREDDVVATAATVVGTTEAEEEAYQYQLQQYGGAETRTECFVEALFQSFLPFQLSLGMIVEKNNGNLFSNIVYKVPFPFASICEAGSMMEAMFDGFSYSPNCNEKHLLASLLFNAVQVCADSNSFAFSTVFRDSIDLADYFFDAADVSSYQDRFLEVVDNAIEDDVSAESLQNLISTLDDYYYDASSIDGFQLQCGSTAYQLKSSFINNAESYMNDVPKIKTQILYDRYAPAICVGGYGENEPSDDEIKKMAFNDQC